ncbi:hypothetical protein [Pseudonocardia xishanensis]|uniref:Transposase n=1 Tax=Pseudonocardia xishanensis TaxID=630995 RepID=A0ABP8S3J5_9PSEU
MQDLTTIAVNRAGYARLRYWTSELAAGTPVVFRVEGTGSYVAGLASFLSRAGDQVIGVNRGDRTVPHPCGKDATIGAETTARVAMICQSRSQEDTATNARFQAIVTLEMVLVNAPAELCEALRRLNDREPLEACRACVSSRWTDSKTPPTTPCARSPTAPGQARRRLPHPGRFRQDQPPPAQIEVGTAGGATPRCTGTISSSSACASINA